LALFPPNVNTYVDLDEEAETFLPLDFFEDFFVVFFDFLAFFTAIVIPWTNNNSLFFQNFEHNINRL
jgi:hypothetical protein